MFHIILFNPEIPSNTGNILRVCNNTGTFIHIIKPMGFQLSDKKLKRAGMDYINFENIKLYDNFEDCLNNNKIENLYALSKFGETNAFSKNYYQGDGFVFGCESSGLPQTVLKLILKDNKVRIPMTDNNRSLNLSNSVSIMIYEAWRQNDFINAKII